MTADKGGAVAISGYLFQVLSATGLQISAESDEGLTPETDARFWVHEAYGQDLAVENTTLKSVQLIQIKYSQHAEGSRIAKGELQDIVRRLVTSSEIANEASISVSSCVLMSNRGLSEEAEELRANPDLGDNPRKRRRRQGSTEPQEPNSPPPPWKPGHKLLLKDLKIEFVTPEDIYTSLVTFAARYGVLEAELMDSIPTLLGRVFTQVSALKSKAVTLQDFVHAFTGNRDTACLQRAHQQPNQYKELAYLDPNWKLNNKRYVPREVVNQLLSAFIQRSIVVFCGNGGTGKSASLCQFASDIVEAKEGPFIRARQAKLAPHHWAAACANEWRDLPELNESKLAVALKRLKSANLDIGPPLLFFTLDGVDDKLSTDREDDLISLIEAASALDGKQADFRLFITCREPRDIERYFPQPSDGFEQDLSNSYHRIDFDRFSKSEFVYLVEMEAGKYSRFLLRDDFTLSARSISSLAVSSKTTVEKYDFLRDPLLWRAFTDMNANEQVDLLEEKASGEIALGEKVVRRFCKKAHSRLGISENDYFLQTLKAVALALTDEATKWTRQLWGEMGCKFGEVLSRSECTELFDEALSGGLINLPVNDWNWRHKSIPLFLKS